jgi:hypothetical protein
MLKPLSSIYQPDERFRHLSFHDQAAGHIRPICAVDLHNEVSPIELNSAVPPEVRYQFDVVRNAYLYSWFVYDLVILAEQHSYIVLEMALRHRAKLEGLMKNATLKPYLQLAIKRGWLRREDLDIPGAPGSRPMSFSNELPKLRNRLLHGSVHLSPEFSLMVMRKCAELLNKLYPAEL